MKTLAEFIKEYRKNNKMTQQELADRAGLSKGFISQLENEYSPGKSGKTMTPSLFTLKQLANAMGINSDYLLSIIDEKPNDFEDPNISKIDDILDVISDILSDNKYILDENNDIYTIHELNGNIIRQLSLGELIDLYNNAVKNNTLSYRTFTEATPDSVTAVSMDKIVFDDYFPLHYCTNLSAGSFDEILEAEPDAVVYVPIKFQGHRRKLLAFQVNGTSMNNVIEDHSIVVVENTSTDGINYKDGTIIVAYCDGLVTVKRIYKQPDGNISLVPDSTDKTHLPIMINPEEHPITIIGKVLWHMNPDDIAEKKY